MTSQESPDGANGAGEQAPNGELEEASPIAAGGFSPEDWAILERRARELARPAVEDEAGLGERVEVLTFYLAGETYAVPVEHVREVRPLERLTPVPCTPNFVVGVVNLRGSILSLLDFRRLLDVPQEGIADLMSVIVVEAAGLEVGIAVNRVGEVVWLPLAELEEPPATVGGIEAEYITGVSAGGLILLNLETILGDERVVVNEELA